MANNQYPTGTTMVSKLGTGLDSRHWTAIITLGALALLILIRRGFRGVSAFGASARIG